jgi:hypothetical protein
MPQHQVEKRPFHYRDYDRSRRLRRYNPLCSAQNPLTLSGFTENSNNEIYIYIYINHIDLIKVVWNVWDTQKGSLAY